MEDLKLAMQDKKVEIADKSNVESKLRKILQGGPDQLQFIVDFDYTVTKVHNDGKPLDCSWGVLENYEELPSDYHKKVKQVKDKYYPVELDLSISLEDKIPIMIQWYKEANGLLGESGVNRSWFPKMVAQSNCELRDDTPLLLNRLNKAKVPVLVMSAGLGDLVREILIHFGVFHDNTTLVSNFLKFDEEGKVVGLKDDEELIHMYNKSECILKRSDKQLTNRKNIVLLGDSLGDLQMADGVVDPNVVLTVGFLNKNIETSLEVYKENFDIVLVDDQTMTFPNALVSDVCNNSSASN